MIVIESATITLPDGYNGHTVELYAEPIRRDGYHVLLRCAEPGREFLVRWAHVGDLPDYIAHKDYRRLTMTLEPGTTYDVTTLDFCGWTAGDGSSTDGYAVEHYFDERGRYLGPDAHGIEPEFYLVAA